VLIRDGWVVVVVILAIIGQRDRVLAVMVVAALSTGKGMEIKMESIALFSFTSEPNIRLPTTYLIDTDI
jgi:hypothetical protein